VETGTQSVGEKFILVDVSCNLISFHFTSAILGIDHQYLLPCLTAIAEARRSEVIMQKAGNSATLECFLLPTWYQAFSTDLTATDWYYMDLRSASVVRPTKGSPIEGGIESRYTIINNSSLGHSSLVINDLQLGDFGLYICDTKHYSMTAFNVSVTRGWF